MTYDNILKPLYLLLVLCDTSILIVDTYVTIQYRQSHHIPWSIIAVKNIVRRRKFREYRRYHASRTTGQRAACKPTMPKRT